MTYKIVNAGMLGCSDAGILKISNIGILVYVSIGNKKAELIGYDFVQHSQKDFEIFLSVILPQILFQKRTQLYIVVLWRKRFNNFRDLQQFFF